jgi:hypothetical protein
VRAPVVAGTQLLARRIDRVGDPEPLEFGEPRNRQAAVLHAQREDHAAREKFIAVFQRDDVKAFALRETDRAPGYHDVRRELGGLKPRPLGQVGSRQPGREAEVILDPCGGCGLPAHRHRVEHSSQQSTRAP